MLVKRFLRTAAVGAAMVLAVSFSSMAFARGGGGGGGGHGGGLEEASAAGARALVASAAAEAVDTAADSVTRIRASPGHAVSPAPVNHSANFGSYANRGNANFGNAGRDFGANRGYNTFAGNRYGYGGYGGYGRYGNYFNRGWFGYGLGYGLGYGYGWGWPSYGWDWGWGYPYAYSLYGSYYPYSDYYYQYPDTSTDYSYGSAAVAPTTTPVTTPTVAANDQGSDNQGSEAALQYYSEGRARLCRATTRPL